MSQRIALAWQAGVTGEYTTAPGSKVRFTAGFAVLFDEAGCVWALRRPGLTFQPLPPYVEQIGVWLRRCGELQPPCATIQLPEGWTLGPAPSYCVTRDDAPPPLLLLDCEPETEVPPPVSAVPGVAAPVSVARRRHRARGQSVAQQKMSTAWTPERKAAASAAMKARNAARREAAAS